MFKDIQATIEIDLSKSEEELFKQVDKDAKWGIKKAEKEGIVVDLIKSEKDLKRFYDIYRRTIILGGIAPDNIKNLKKENYQLFIAKKNNQVIAGAIIEIINKEVFKLEYNASLQDYLKFQPNNLLYWTLIKWGKSKGFKTFDLGGYQLKAQGHLSGINKFKERWGGQVKTYYIKSWNPIYILGRKIIRNVPLVKKLKDWSKLEVYLIKEGYSKNSIKKFGLFCFLNKVFKKYLYSNTSVLLYSADLSNNEIIEPKVDAAFKQVGLDEMLILMRNKNLLQKELIEERFYEGHACFAYFINSELAHYSWAGFKEMNISEANIKIPMEKNQAVIYDCHTFEEFRGKGIYPSMLTKIKEYLKEGGLAKCYIYVESENLASIKGIEKAGFKKEKILTYLNIISFKNRKVSDIK